MNRRRMHLGMSIRGLGYHPAAWRHPDVPADGTLRFDHYARSAQAAERGKCDLVFFADGIGIRERDVPRGSLARSGYEIVEMEPLTLLPALAVVTKHIGLVTTASTTYNEPFNIAASSRRSILSATAAPAGMWSPHGRRRRPGISIASSMSTTTRVMRARPSL